MKKTSLWGGRFKKGMDPLLKKFSYSLAVDHHLLGSEMKVNAAWTRMLVRMKILSQVEGSRMLSALKSVEKELTSQPVCNLLDKVEDVHTLIQDALEKKVGILGKKIHTGRSRNDLVITSTKIFLKDEIAQVSKEIKKAQKALVGAAVKSRDSVVAGVTHLRKAQPVLVAHHLLAYVEMFEEDLSRLLDAAKRMDVLPLGSAALAGSSLPIDRKFLAKELGFSRVSGNSLHTVSDRAFIAEILSALAILWMHISRLSEDMILWNSEFFGYIELDDAFSTGSSLMPQKKNPDVFELLRGRSAVIMGYLQSILILQKGLPLSYNRDLQEDKPALFDALSKTHIGLEIMAETIATMEFDFSAIARSVEDDNLYATDLLEYLVRKKMPFREAHEIVGSVVAYSSQNKRKMSSLTLQEWQKFSKLMNADVSKLFDPHTSIQGKKTIGSTHPSEVQKAIRFWNAKLRS